MDSRSYFGESSSGRGSRSGSSRRGKKSSSSEKPKQPQRGLGVAQLEKIRLRSETGCSYGPSFHDPPSINVQEGNHMRIEMGFASSAPTVSFASNSSLGYHTNIMMGYRGMHAREFHREHSLPMVTSSTWNTNSISSPEPLSPEPLSHAMHSNITRPFFSMPREALSQKKRSYNRCDSIGSSSQNSDAGERHEEIDLDLKLSL